MDRPLLSKLPDAFNNLRQNPKYGFGSISVADPIVAVGPKVVITMVNDAIQIQVKDTLKELYIDSTGTFWDVQEFDFSPGDPWVVYDEFSNRFWLSTWEDGYIFLAVSKDSNPQGKDDFYKYLYIAPDVLPDFLKIAVDKESLVLTWQAVTNVVVGNDVAAFDKAPLLAGPGSQGTDFDVISPVYYERFAPFANELVEGAQAGFIFPLQPRQNKCGGVEKVLLIRAQPEVLGSADSPVIGNKIRIIQIQNVLTNPQAVYADVTVSQYRTATYSASGDLPAFHDTVPQPPPLTSTNIPIREMDSLSQGFFATGVVSGNSIIAAHDILSDDNRSIVRWYEFDVSRFLQNNQVSVIQQGNLDAGGTINQICPSINVDKCGNIGVHVTIVGENQYPALAYTGRLERDPKGTMRMPYEIVAGGDIYYQRTPLRNGRTRWGDYSGLAVDPCDHETFWFYNMYAVAVNPYINGSIIIKVEGVGEFPAILAAYSQPFSTISAPGGLAEPNGLPPQILACAPLKDPVVDLTGEIGICLRGNCNFVNKTENIEAAGAIATIIVNNTNSPIFAAGGPPTGNYPTVMVSNSDGVKIIDKIKDSQDPIKITMETSPTYGSDWSTFLGSFKLGKNGCTTNAPETSNLLA